MDRLSWQPLPDIEKSRRLVQFSAFHVTIGSCRSLCAVSSAICLAFSIVGHHASASNVRGSVTAVTDCQEEPSGNEGRYCELEFFSTVFGFAPNHAFILNKN